MAMMGCAPLFLLLASGIVNLLLIETATTASPQSSTPDSSGTCKLECKYGDCKNGTCECIKIFQGNDCRQPKPWFLAAACIAGTLLLILMCCCICCLCQACGSGNDPKVKPAD